MRLCSKVKALNKAIKYAPFGRRTFVPRAVYGGRYAKENLVNFKVVAIYTILYFSLGVLLGIPEGLWAGSTDDVHIFSTKSYFLGKFLVWIVIDIIFFSHFFKRNTPNPIIASAIIVVLAWAIDAVLVYFFTAITPYALLVTIDFLGTSIAILIAYFLRVKMLGHPRNA